MRNEIKVNGNGSQNGQFTAVRVLHRPVNCHKDRYVAVLLDEGQDYDPGLRKKLRRRSVECVCELCIKKSKAAGQQEMLIEKAKEWAAKRDIPLEEEDFYPIQDVWDWTEELFPS